MKGIIDRFEENYVVVELQDRTIINIEKSKCQAMQKKEMYLILIKILYGSIRMKLRN